MTFFETGLGIFVIMLLQVLAVVGFVMISLLFLVYGDRKIWGAVQLRNCLLYTSPSPRDRTRSRMPSSA